MIIKSRFKDYYDHVAYQYGGGDPKYTYVRDKLSDDKLIVDLNLVDQKSYEILSSIWYLKRYNIDTNFKIICAAGKIFLAITEGNIYNFDKDYELLSEDSHPDSYKRLCGSSGRFFSRNNKLSDFINAEYNFVTSISKIIKEPVFSITSITYEKKDEWQFCIESNVPILKDYGIASIIPAEQIYQELAYFVSNKMVTSPDLLVKSNLTDKEKILQHGFDIKESFRHR